MTQMNKEFFGEVSIFRPNLNIEIEKREEIESFVRKNYAPGKYVGDTISPIFHCIVEYLDAKIRQNIIKIISRDFIEFILFQYDQATLIQKNRNNLSTQEKKRWDELGPIFRRSTKYIAEITTLQHQTDTISRLSEDECLSILSAIYIYTEELFTFCNASDAAFYLFPEDTIIEITKPSEEHFFKYYTKQEVFNDMRRRVDFDTQNKHKYIEDKEIIYDLAIKERFLNNAFTNTLKCSFSDCIACLKNIIDNSIPSPQNKSFPVLYIQQEKIYSILSDISGIERCVIEKIVSGFTLTQNNLIDRKAYKPKQKYRALARAFFEWDDIDYGKHFVWSSQMAMEALLFLIRDITFSILPFEWKSKNTEIALGHLNGYVGKWFETVSKKQLELLGYTVLCGLKSIGVGQNRLIIPQEGIGEIDILAYSQKQNILLIGECKMVKEGFDPVYFKDSLSEFVNSEKSYANKFKAKIEWVAQNIQAVYNALLHLTEFKQMQKPSTLVPIMLTYAPSFAEYYIEDFPCVSLTEFCEKHKSQINYPFQKGIIVL